MELKFFQIIFNNGKEFFVESQIGNDISFLLTLEEGGKHRDFISLQKVTSGPTDRQYNDNALNIKRDELFSVQEVSKELIGAQSKRWRLA